MYIRRMDLKAQLAMLFAAQWKEREAQFYQHRGHQLPSNDEVINQAASLMDELSGSLGFAYWLMGDEAKREEAEKISETVYKVLEGRQKETAS